MRIAVWRSRSAFCLCLPLAPSRASLEIMSVFKVTPPRAADHETAPAASCCTCKDDADTTMRLMDVCTRELEVCNGLNLVGFRGYRVERV